MNCSDNLSQDVLPFLESKYQEGIISSEQMAGISSCVDAGISYKELLESFNLYIDYVRHSQQSRYNKHIDIMQQSILARQLQKIHREIEAIKSTIVKLELPLEEPRVVLSYWQDRLNRFPENQHFQKEVEQRKKALEPSEKKLQEMYSQLEVLESENAKINKALEEVIV